MFRGQLKFSESWTVPWLSDAKRGDLFSWKSVGINVLRHPVSSALFGYFAVPLSGCKWLRAEGFPRPFVRIPRLWTGHRRSDSQSWMNETRHRSTIDTSDVQGFSFAFSFVLSRFFPDSSFDLSDDHEKNRRFFAAPSVTRRVCTIGWRNCLLHVGKQEQSNCEASEPLDRVFSTCEKLLRSSGRAKERFRFCTRYRKLVSYDTFFIQQFTSVRH